MTCQICNTNPATIVVKKIINGEQTEMRLCEKCAKSQLAEVTSMFNFADLFGAFTPLNHNLNAMSKDHGEKNLICPTCNTDMEQLKKTGKVGCMKCYEVFGEYMEPYIKDIHTKTVHTGKVPKIAVAENENGENSSLREISRIKRQLEEAVREENYELAAEYRDLIHALSAKEESEID